MAAIKKKIILFTAGFPFGFGESFLENELPFLADAFDELLIVPKNVENKNNPRKTPSNCTILSLIYGQRKFRAIKHFFKFEVLKEACSLLFSKDSFSKLKVLVDQLFLAEHNIEFLINNVRKEDEQIVYSYWTDETAIAFCLIKHEFPKTKFITRAHGWDVYFERHTIPYLPLRPLLSKKLDAIYFISADGKAYFDRIKGVTALVSKTSRLGTIRNSKELSPAQTSTFKIVSCSSLIPLKQLDLLIDALACLEINFHWYHIGDGPLMTILKSQASTVLKEESYSFLGQLTNSKVCNFYADNAINAFINTSSTEGIPVSIMEALSYGIPCIGPDVGGIKEIINHGINGLLLSAQPTALDISNALLQLANLSSEDHKKIRESSFNLWNEKYNAEINYKLFIEDIKQL